MTVIMIKMLSTNQRLYAFTKMLITIVKVIM